MSDGIKIKLMLFLNMGISVFGIWYLVTTEDYHWLWFTLIGYLSLSILGNSVGYHRYLCHKAFKTNTFWKRVILTQGVLMGLSPPITFALIHRTHHKYPDVDGDPHSPHLMGVLRAATGFGWPEVKYNLRLVADLLRDEDVKLLQKYYFLVPFLYCIPLAIYDPLLPVFFYCIPAVIVWFVFCGSSAICHMYGYRNFETNDKSVNSILVSIFLMAEGWHNNHHAKPNDWTNWYKWWELDIPTIIIWLIKDRKTK